MLWRLPKAMTCRVHPVADDYAKELLDFHIKNPEVLLASTGASHATCRSYCQASDELVLEVAERCTQSCSRKGRVTGVRMPYGENFVSIAIAIQRSQGHFGVARWICTEQLLDGAAYGAEEAAAASLSRI